MPTSMISDLVVSSRDACRELVLRYYRWMKLASSPSISAADPSEAEKVKAGTHAANVLSENKSTKASTIKKQSQPKQSEKLKSIKAGLLLIIALTIGMAMRSERFLFCNLLQSCSNRERRLRTLLYNPRKTAL